MGVTLDPAATSKVGDKIVLGDLDKAANVWLFGLGWDVAAVGQAFDLDAWTFMVTGKEVEATDRVVFYNKNDRTAQVSDASGAVTYMGDNRDGRGDGDDETVRVDLSRIPSDVTEIVVVVNIYKAVERGNQTFDQVSNAYVRMIIEGERVEKRNFSLSSKAGGKNTVVFARIVRVGSGNTPSDWSFEPIEQYTNSLSEAGGNYGVSM